MSMYNVMSLILIYLFIGFVFSYLIYKLVYLKSKQEENKYFLYKVRDELILLVASGKLRENDFLFEVYYPMVNDLINKINSFKFNTIIKALANKEDYIKASEAMKKVDAELKKQSNDVKNVINDFYKSISIIIYRNSLLFRFIFRLVFSFAFILDFFKRHKSIFSLMGNQSKALDYSIFIQSRTR